MRIVHLSDVHIQIDHLKLPLRRWGWRRAIAQVEWIGLGRARRFQGAMEIFGRVVAEIKELKPDQVVISGDITALAVEEEFEMACSVLTALDPRILSVVPGNHDRYTAQAVRERRFEKYFGHLLHSDLENGLGSKLYPLVRLVKDELAVIGLDSTRLAPLPGISFGRLGKEQLESLASLLEQPSLRHRHLCVVVHHAPLRRNGRPDRVAHGLLDGKELLRLLLGRRCSVHHGHVHQRYWHRANDYRPHLFNAGSVTMHGSQGYWVIELGADGSIEAEARLLE